MKFWKIVLSLFIAGIIATTLPSCTLAKYKKKARLIQVSNVDLATIKNGAYEGYYDIYKVDAHVLVEMENGKIRNIRLINHKCVDGYSGEKIVDTVLKEQSLHVDAITGATNSCMTILKAIEVALLKGLK